jgi:hypothetical protein
MPVGELGINADIFLSEEELEIWKMASDFAKREVVPLADKFDKEKDLPEELFKKMSEQGFLSAYVPQDYGGSEIGSTGLGLILIELNKACASVGTMVSVHNSLGTWPIANFGSKQQKDKYLPKLATGEYIGAFALTEAEAGSDAGATKTTAKKEGDYYILDGSKLFVTNGRWAHVFIIFARTHPDPSLKTRGISAFIVEKGMEGFTIGPEQEKLGIHASSTVSLYFDKCKVPAENLLGKENEGFKVAMATLDNGRLGIAAQGIGIACACLEASVRYSKERVQFGRPIAEFQAIQWKLADMAVDIDAAFFLFLRAARLSDKGLPFTKEAAAAKLLASEIANKHASQAVQILGGYGYTKDFPVERFFRDAKITEIYEGTSEVQRIVISRALLK